MKSLKSYFHKGKIERKVASELLNGMKDEILKDVQQAKASRIRETLQKMQNEKGEFSPDKFWKLKKSISPRSEERTSIINDENVELFDPINILEEFKKEFKNRLTHRQIDPSLRNFEETTDKLIHLCLETAAEREISDFSDDEIDRAIHTLKQGKSAGTDRYPPDVFLAAGPKLRSYITTMFNNIKNKLSIPDVWFELIVATIFKNKGTKKKTKYYRGVFLACVLYKIFEKVIKQRVASNLESIDLSQSGARTNKSPGDSMFLLQSVTSCPFGQ